MITRVEEPPYGKLAFWNPYNLSLFVGGVAAGLLTGHHWISVLVCAAEAFWMIWAPDSKLLRAIWFDRALAAKLEAEKHDSRATKLASMSPDDQARIGRLAQQKDVIERLAKENPSLTVDLLASELEKLDALTDDFADLAVTAWRIEAHAQTFDFEAMRRAWHVHDNATRAHRVGDPRREVAEKNLEVLERRRARYDDLVRKIQVTRGQMELIEQTFRLLADEIVTIASPTELGVRIDELRVAVDAVRETAGEPIFLDDSETEVETRHERYR
jgi:hypothetical protein